MGLKFYKPKELAKVIGVSYQRTLMLYQDPMFPTIYIGRQQVAEEEAIRNYFSKRRKK